MNGFSYNGIHCNDMHVGYGENPTIRWWKDAEFETYKTDVAWRHGGYWFGNAANIREITLECYYEEITIAQKEKIKRWLGRNTKGKLVFDSKPFVYYEVRPDTVVEGVMYPDNDKFSGTFSVTFTAVDPFGYLTRKYNDGENDGAEDYCGIIPENEMPAAPTVSDRAFYVYNPGTEPCGMTLRVSGSSENPVRFFNNRNGTSCVISSFPEGGILILDIDGETGFVKTYTSGSSSYDNGFAYHDYGIVRLEPCETYYDVPYTAVRNGTLYDITLSGVAVSEDMIGAYITFNSPSTLHANVQSVNPAENKLVCKTSGSGTIQTSGMMRISTMNYIVIQEQNSNGGWTNPTTLALSSIAVDYTPRLL